MEDVPTAVATSATRRPRTEEEGEEDGAAPRALEGEGNQEQDVSEEEPTYREHAKFKTFRKHARDLYQSLACQETVWPSKSVQYLPYTKPAPLGCEEQLLITGTSTFGEEQNYVKILSLVLPTVHELHGCQYDDELRELGAFGMAPAAVRFKSDLLMAHEGNVQKVRYMPQNPNILASASSDNNVYIFDRSHILRTAAPNKPPRPQLPLLPPPPDSNAPYEHRRHWNAKKVAHDNAVAQQAHWDSKRHPAQHRVALQGPVTNGWSLDWNPHQAGTVCCGGNEGVAVWSLAELRKTDAGSTHEPMDFIARQHGINDCKWSPWSPSLLLCASGGGTTNSQVVELDLRAPEKAVTWAAGCGPIANSVDWCMGRDTVVAVGGSDGGAHIFDLRSTNAPLSVFKAHATDTETTVAWCPFDSNLLATAAADGNASILDVTSNAQRFVHTGHGDAVMDIAWSPHRSFAGQLCTVDSNALMAWKPRNRFLFL